MFCKEPFKKNEKDCLMNIKSGKIVINIDNSKFSREPISYTSHNIDIGKCKYILKWVTQIRTARNFMKEETNERKVIETDSIESINLAETRTYGAISLVIRIPGK